MKTKTFRNALTVLAVGSVLFVPAIGSAATASTKAPAPVTNTNTLKVSPLRTDLSIQPGQSKTVTTNVSNLTSSPIVIHPIQNDFVAGDENGTPSIVLDENSYAPTHSLKRFMVPLKNVTIPANSTQEVKVTITVPKSAQSGGYFGAIRFAPASEDGSKSVNLSSSVASLILMTVPGPTTEKLTLTNFDVQQDGSTATNFRNPDDLKLLLRFKNEGNLQEAPFGQIYVKKGNKVIYTYEFNQQTPKDTVLPDSARRWIVPVNNLGKFGKYTVGGTITHGTKNETIEVSKTIWIVPSTYIMAGIVAAGVLVLLIVGFILFLKGYKRRLLGGSSRSRGRSSRSNYRRR